MTNAVTASMAAVKAWVVGNSGVRGVGEGEEDAVCGGVTVGLVVGLVVGVVEGVTVCVGVAVVVAVDVGEAAT